MLGHTGPKQMEMSRIYEDDYTYQIAVMGGRTAGKKTLIEYMLKVIILHTLKTCLFF